MDGDQKSLGPQHKPSLTITEHIWFAEKENRLN